MATILELAEHSDLPVETVLRVVNGEPTSQEANDRVALAVAALGPPNYPRFAPTSTSTEILPAEETMMEAVRVEVRPVSDNVAQLRALFEEVASRLAQERRERVDDVALVTELMIEGWRNVDRRLGRIEKVLERLSASAEEHTENGKRVVRMDDYPRTG